MNKKIKIYTQNEVKKATLEYFDGDELATDVWMDKYALKNENDEFLELTPDDMHRRLAKEYARIEKKYKNPLSEDEIYESLKGFRYIVPQGSPMSGIGNNYRIQSLSNCFVVEPPLDSYSSIMKTDQELVHIFRNRGGAGTDLSNLRPKGFQVNNAAGTSSGIGPFIKRFSNTTGEVSQGGRRGAAILTISCHHPEIKTFINIKKEKGVAENVNISIFWTDEFLKAVENKEKVQLRFPVEKEVKHQYEEMVDAKEIWDEFVEAAWSSAEPGCLFHDTMKKETPSEMYVSQRFHSTNPCSEILLPSYGACNLLLLNLTSFVKSAFTKKSCFDYDLFSNYVSKAQRLLDDQVDLELEKIDIILEKITKDPESEEVKYIEKTLWRNVKKILMEGRRTGLGITGLGDVIAMMKYEYSSKKGIELSKKIYEKLSDSSYESSIKLSKERGSFPIYDKELEKMANNPFMERLFERCPSLKIEMEKYGRRNIAITTTAPAGSVSCLTKTTSGIEPVIFLEYNRKRKLENGEWEKYKVFHYGLEKWIKITNNQNIEESPYFNSTSDKIDWLAGVELQSVCQKNVCHSISKTVNLPKNVAKSVVNDVFLHAWKKGLKGITVYVEGSRDAVLYKEKNELKESCPPKRPEILPCDIHRVTIKGEKWTIFVGLYDGKPYEVFAGLSEYIEIPNRLKNGFIHKRKLKTKASKYDLCFKEDEIKIKDIVKLFENPNHGVMTRILSLSLRHGSKPNFLVEQLGYDTESDFSSFSKVMARVLKKYIKNGEEVRGIEKSCKECGSKLIYQEGCVNCLSCGFSKCS